MWYFIHKQNSVGTWSYVQSTITSFYHHLISYPIIIFAVCGTNLDMNAGSCVCAADFYQTEIINEVPQCTACPAGSTRAITDAATIDGCGM